MVRGRAKLKAIRQPAARLEVKPAFSASNDRDVTVFGDAAAAGVNGSG